MPFIPPFDFRPCRR